MYSSYTESAAQIAARKARILASRPQEPVCICLEVIGDNGDCPVHGPAPTKASGGDHG